jgi:DTW domain-containing protein YfiP
MESILTQQVPQRQLCSRCQRPLTACICRWIAPHANLAEVLILQHPQEVKEAKGSARLLQLSLAHCSLLVGEVFEDVSLREQLFAGGRQPVLLYPEDPPGGSAPPAPAPPALPSTENRQAEGLRLVVLDGTWRKSRKMLYLNPALQALPRLALHDMPAGRYHIRKAQRAGQLSTLEATCYALAVLEKREHGYEGLLQAFDAFVSCYAEQKQKGMQARGKAM